jgi:hypothetical protein
MLAGVRRVFQKSPRLDRRKRGQLRIAEALDRLRKFGYRVLHDLSHDGYHLEHVIVGPTGVFAIETRFRSSDPKLESEAYEHPARNVNQIIKKNCEFDGWIWPLVVISGEWRVKNDLQTASARLFTIDKLVNHIVNQQSRFTSTEVKLIASHLEPSAKLIVRLGKKKSELSPGTQQTA